MRGSLLIRLLIVIAVAILPSIVIQVIALWRIHDDGVVTVKRQAEHVLGLLEDEHRQIIEGVRQVLTAMADTGMLRRQDYAACQAYMDRHRTSLPGWQNISVMDRDGTVVCGTLDKAIGQNFADKEHVQLALSGNRFAPGGYSVSRATGDPIIPFSVPFRDDAGNVAGVVTMTVGLDWLNGFLAKRALPSGTSVAVMDRDGIVLARAPRMQEIEGKPLDPQYRWMLQQPGPRVERMEGYNAIPRTFGAVRTSAFFLAVGLDERVVIDPIHRDALTRLAWLALGAAAAFGAGLLFHFIWFRRPLRHMLGVAKAWVLGDASARLAVPLGLTELDDVAVAFNQAADAAEDRARVWTRFRALADNIPQLAWMATSGGGIFWYNKRWQETIGAPPADVGGWRAFTHPEHCGRVLNGIVRSWETGQSWEDTFLFKTAGGEYRWFLSRALPIRDEAGDIVLWFGTHTDVTEQMGVKQALKEAKDAADAANMSKSKFLAAASHDLRQPVQALVLFTSALRERLGDHPAQAAVGHMQASVEALQAMLDALLDISRLDAAIVEPKPSVFAIGTLLDSLGVEYGARFQEQGLHLRVVGSKACVLTDPTLLERILRNLIENALRYTRAGGRVLVGCRRNGGALRVDVLDTGIGIAEHHLAQVFDEFYQVGNPERDRSRGLGLGLSIVKRLTQLLGLRIEVQSVEGRGSRFSVEVPLVAPPQPSSATALAAPRSQRLNGMVLVIDDDKLVRDALAYRLRDWGVAVVEADCARSAIDQLREFKQVPDAVIADYQLADARTGIQAIREVAAAIGAVPHAIVLTGDTAHDRIAEVLSHGYGLLHKPVSPESLFQVLASVLAEKPDKRMDEDAPPPARELRPVARGA